MQTFFFILLLLIIITVVIDFSEKVDNFIKSEATWKAIVTKYYFNFIPHISALLGPFFVLVAVVFFTSQLASRSEIVAMTSGGVSFYRLLLPYLFTASLLAGFLYVSNHYWVPNANKTRLDFELNYLTNWRMNWYNHIHRQIGDNTFIYMASYSQKDSSGNKFTLEQIEDDEIKYKLMANKANWNKETEEWDLERYMIRRFDGENETIEKGTKLDTLLNLRPEDLELQIGGKEQMTTPELKVYIAELQAAGQDSIEFYELEKYRRTSSIFALLILTVIGYSLASRKVRGGLGVHIVTAIILASLFELTMKFSTTFTTNSDLHPFLGVWIPNFIFSVLAIFLVVKAQK